MNDYGTMPDATIIINSYEDFMNGKEVADTDMEILLHFFYEIVGCISLTWKKKASKGGEYSKLTTTSDEAFALFLIKYYDRLPKKDSKKQKLSGTKMDEAMEYFCETLAEIKGVKSGNKERILQLDKEIQNYITCTKGQHDNDKSTQRTLKIEKDLKNMHGVETLFGTPVQHMYSL